jgi:hypothetical protein
LVSNAREERFSDTYAMSDNGIDVADEMVNWLVETIKLPGSVGKAAAFVAAVNPTMNASEPTLTSPTPSRGT